MAQSVQARTVTSEPLENPADFLDVAARHGSVKADCSAIDDGMSNPG